MTSRTPRPATSRNGVVGRQRHDHAKRAEAHAQPAGTKQERPLQHFHRCRPFSLADIRFFMSIIRPWPESPDTIPSEDRRCRNQDAALVLREAARLFLHRTGHHGADRHHHLGNLLVRDAVRCLGQAVHSGAYNPDNYLPFHVPGFGLIFALITITLIGSLAANLVGRTLIGLWDKLLNRTPVVRSIYKGSKQIFETLFSQKGASFRYVCLVEWPRRGAWSIAFVSREVDGGHIGLEDGPRDVCSLCVHHTQPDVGLCVLRRCGGSEDSRHDGRGWAETGDLHGPRLPRPAAGTGRGSAARRGRRGGRGERRRRAKKAET